MRAFALSARRLSDTSATCCTAWASIQCFSYIGARKGRPDQIVCGVELNLPMGEHGGTVDGNSYFVCPQQYGVLVSPAQIRGEEEEC